MYKITADSWYSLYHMHPELYYLTGDSEEVNAILQKYNATFVLCESASSGLPYLTFSFETEEDYIYFCLVET